MNKMLSDLLNITQSDNYLTWLCILPNDIKNIIYKYLMYFKYHDDVLTELQFSIKILNKYVTRSEELIKTHAIPIYIPNHFCNIQKNIYVKPSILSVLIKHSLIYGARNNPEFLNVYQVVKDHDEKNKEHLSYFTALFTIIFKDIDQDIILYKHKITQIKIFYKNNLCILNNSIPNYTKYYINNFSEDTYSSYWRDNIVSFKKYLFEFVDVNTQKMQLIDYLNFLIYNCGHLRSILIKCLNYIDYINHIDY